MINIMTLKTSLAVDKPKTTTKEMDAELCTLSASSPTQQTEKFYEYEFTVFVTVILPSHINEQNNQCKKKRILLIKK